MPLDERDYIRGRHPPACTCVSCDQQRRRRPLLVTRLRWLVSDLRRRLKI